jgi:hypothetical protein
MLASHEWERLPAAAALARRYPDAIVLITVPRAITIHNCHRCGGRVEWLEAEGVPRSRIRLLTVAGNNLRRGRSRAGPCGPGAVCEAGDRDHSVPHPQGPGVVPHRVPGLRDRTWLRPGLACWRESGAVVDHSLWRHYVRYEWAALPAYRLRHGVPLGSVPASPEMD